MKTSIKIQKKEKKPRVVIGVARLYNHEKLLSFLSSVGISLKEWAENFNIDTRAEILRTAPEGMIEQELAFENITPTVGFAVITRLLTGNLGDVAEGEITVHAFGDSSTPPSSGDTSLGNETFRKLLSSKSQSGERAFYTVFCALNEANGTHAEMGLFINADAGMPNDGTLWDRSLISLTKNDSQTLTIDYEDTFVNNI